MLHETNTSIGAPEIQYRDQNPRWRTYITGIIDFLENNDKFIVYYVISQVLADALPKSTNIYFLVDSRACKIKTVGQNPGWLPYTTGIMEYSHNNHQLIV